MGKPSKQDLKLSKVLPVAASCSTNAQRRRHPEEATILVSDIFKPLYESVAKRQLSIWATVAVASLSGKIYRLPSKHLVLLSICFL
jgi:hypothetical protein